MHRGAPETIHKLGTMLDAVFRSNQPPGEGMPREFSRNLNPAIREQSGAEATVREQSGVWNVALGANRRVFTSPEQIGAWLFDHDESCLGIPFVHTDDLNYI